MFNIVILPLLLPHSHFVCAQCKSVKRISYCRICFSQHRQSNFKYFLKYFTLWQAHTWPPNLNLSRFLPKRKIKNFFEYDLHLSNLPTLKERCEFQKLWGQGSQRQEARGSEKSRLSVILQNSDAKEIHKTNLSAPLKLFLVANLHLFTLSMWRLIGVRLWPSGVPCNDKKTIKTIFEDKILIMLIISKV